MSEIKEIVRLIEEDGERMREFIKSNDHRFSNLEEKMHLFEGFIAEQKSPFAGVRPSTDRLSADKEVKTFVDFLRTGRDSEIKAMSSGSDPDGGYTIPTQLENAITKNLRNLSVMRQIARVVPVGTSEYKQLHSLGGTGYGWVGETSIRAETDTPTLKELSIPTREVYAMPALTQNLLDDSAFNLSAWIVEELSETFADAEGDAFINGDGITKPRGLFTYDATSTADATRPHDEFQYIPTGASGAFHTTKMDPLITMVYALKPRYRRNAVWLMSPEVLEMVRKLKEATTDRYLWEPATEAGQPSRLLGYPVYEDENLPAVASGSLSAAFGDFTRAYTITDRSTSMLRDPFTAKPYVRFYSTKRVGGGGGRDTRAIKFLKFSAT